MTYGKRARSTRRAQAVFVAGEAGMGKTTLAAEVARAAHADGAVVLFGHADEDLGVAYQPWIEALSTIGGHFDDELTGLPSAQRAALARLLPSTGEAARLVSDPDTERLLLLEGTTAFLAAASARAPLVVVLDDLHWADAASLQLLRRVIGSTVAMDATVVCTYRDTDLSTDDLLNRLLADMHRESNVARVRLAGLEDIELVELVTAAAGHELDDAGVGLAHALRRETDGNPFFTAEMLRHLWEAGAIVVGDDGRFTVASEFDELGLPSSVRDVIGRRVERLGSETRRVLRLAAVVGRDFDLTVLADVAAIDEDPLLDLLDAAVAAAVLVEGDAPERYRFAHALVQHSLYDELSATRRQRAHQRVAELLESETVADDAAALAELARHWVAATRPADLDKALGYVRRAGDAARAALAPDDAIRWYLQALELIDRSTTPDEHQRGELLAALGAVQRQAARPEYRDTLLQAAALAERIDDTNLLAQTALAFRGGNESNFGDEDAKRVAASALDRIGTDPTPLRARLLARLASAHDATLEWQTRHDLALQALDTARHIDDDATFVFVIDTTQNSLATPDRLAENAADLERAVALADRLGDPVHQIQTRYYLTGARYQQCDPAAVGRLIAEMETLVERVGLPSQRADLATAVTGRLILAGHIEQAEAANDRQLELGSAAGQPDAFSLYAANLSNIRRLQGRLDDIVDFFIDVARDNPSIAVLRSSIPAMLCELGRIDEARERLAVEAATDFEFPYDQTWLLGMSRFLDAAASTGELSAARLLVDRVAPYATQVIAGSAAVILGAVARPLARAATTLADYDQAEEWFGAAHDFHARLQAPFFTALTQLDHADLYIARRANGDPEHARDLTATAASTAAEHGYAGLTKRATKLLSDI